MRPLLRWSWRLLGVALVALAGALVFVAAEPLGTEAAVALVAAGTLVLPLVLAALLIRSFRRVDPAAGLLESAAGLAVVVAIAALLVLGLGLRGPVARRLSDLHRRHPAWPAPVLGGARTLGSWLGPARPSPVARRTRRAGPAQGDAGALQHADAGALPRSPALAAGRTAAEPSAPPGPPRSSTPESVWIGDRAAQSLTIGDLGGPVRDEIVVVLGDHDFLRYDVLVFYVDARGRLRERTRLVLHAPPDLVAMVSTPRIVDADEDGRRDLLLCSFYMTERQGMRGGDVWIAYAEADGQLRAPVPATRGTCADADFGDVDGDGHGELVFVHMRNPWLEDRPEGELQWFERRNRRFTLQGRRTVLAWPDRLALLDRTADGVLDAIVEHEDGQPTLVLPGTPRGPGEPQREPSAEALPEPLAAREASLDGDDRPDRVTPVFDRTHGQTLRLERTAPPGPAGDRPERALDYREHVVGTPREPSTADPE